MKFSALTLLSMAASLADAKTFRMSNTFDFEPNTITIDDASCKIFFADCWVPSFNNVSAKYGADITCLSYAIPSLLAPGFLGYGAGGDYSCRRCKRQFNVVEEHLNMLGGFKADFADTLKTCLVNGSAGCDAFKSLDSVDVTFPNNGNVPNAEEFFTSGLTMSVTGVTGNPNSKCTDAIESTFVAVYHNTYPADAKLMSVDFTNISPGPVKSKLLRIGNTDTYNYMGSGIHSNSNNQRDSMTFANKDELLKAVGAEEEFESKLVAALLALSSNDECQAFKSITGVTVTWNHDDEVDFDADMDMIDM